MTYRPWPPRATTSQPAVQLDLADLLTQPTGPQDERAIYDASGVAYDSPACRQGRHEVPHDQWPTDGTALCGGTVIVRRHPGGGVLAGPCRCNCHDRIERWNPHTDDTA
ncbi:MAG TPA: hypothetical protein PKC57_14845 [Microthrixaceae bacterium]|nr:hypothetical protein [Microthrixaceae bacterium]HNB96188.1 hypothetical protein [Microthrixaceae bacterium]HNH97108.1 hypothetical protein [Microthrixaceae bacterium]